MSKTEDTSVETQADPSESEPTSGMHALLRAIADAPPLPIETKGKKVDRYEGQQLGPYHVHRELARGGMGSIYLVSTDGVLGVVRWAAVKVIHPHLSHDRQFVAMFLDEARLAMQISHTNISQVFDFGLWNGLPFLVMEHLQGQTLRRVTHRAGGSMPAWLAARIVADAARGLHAAHTATGPDGVSLEIVHRDVSPSNIFVQYDGVSKVIDFGVAKSRNRLTTTRHDSLKGKLGYMAPEQIRNLGVDARTDVWALGVTLWEAVVGRRLFQAESEGATLLQALDGNIPSPRSFRPDLARPLEEVIFSALERDRNARFPTAAAMADALEAYLYAEGKPTGPAQVADFMATAFESEISESRQLVQTPSPMVAPQSVSEVLGSPLTVSPTTPESVLPRPKVATRGRAAGRAIVGVMALLAAAALYYASRTPPRARPTLAVVAPTDAPPVRRAVPEPVLEPILLAGKPTALPKPLAAAPASHRTRVKSPRAPQPLGYLDLLAIPSSRVFWRGKSLGQTPLIGKPLPAGQQVLVLETLDGRTESVTVQIEPGRHTNRTFRIPER